MIQVQQHVDFMARLETASMEARRIAWGSSADFASNVRLAELVILVDDALANGLDCDRIEAVINGMNDSNYEQKAGYLKRLSLMRVI